jgi:hypothetical protein
MRLSGAAMLADTIRLLIQHFGEEKVLSAVEKATGGKRTKKSELTRKKTGTKLTITDELDELRTTDREKYDLLTPFLNRLEERHVLKDAQDIRHFIQVIGVKHVTGKSRKELIPSLIRSMISMSVQDIYDGIAKSDSISEDQRQKGFSILTDKLLNN